MSNYSCRGPGLRVGLKPDLAHIGGSGTRHATLGHGLLSLDAAGQVVDSCGTSYAAPNVAKTLASLDHAIEGTVSRETLIGLGIHLAVLPDSLNDRNLQSVTYLEFSVMRPRPKRSAIAGTGVGSFLHVLLPFQTCKNSFPATNKPVHSL